jgi:hypothetical protein
MGRKNNCKYKEKNVEQKRGWLYERVWLLDLCLPFFDRLPLFMSRLPKTKSNTSYFLSKRQRKDFLEEEKFQLTFF